MAKIKVACFFLGHGVVDKQACTIPVPLVSLNQFDGTLYRTI